MKSNIYLQIVVIILLIFLASTTLLSEKYIGVDGPQNQNWQGAPVDMGADNILHWKEGVVDWYLHYLGAGDGLSFEDTRLDVQAACNEWEAVLTAEIAFNYVGSTSNTWSIDYKNVHYWAEAGDPAFDPTMPLSSGGIAVTVITFNDAEEILDVDIIYNGRDKTWTLINYEYNVMSVATHEIGHQFGLHHTENFQQNPVPTMAPIYSYDYRTVEFDDKVGVSFLYGGYLIDDETFSDEKYFNWDLTVVGDPYEIPATTLTIDPGATIKFASNKKLIVEGNLISEGTSSNFVSFGCIDSEGYWNGIEINGSYAFASIDYCNIENATTAISVNNNNCNISNSNISNNYYGIYISSAEPVISNCDITDNNYGIRIWDSYDPVWNDNHILGNTISNNGYAAYLVNSSPTFAGNLIQSNHRGAALWYSSNPIFINNDVLESDLEGISCYGSASPDMYFNPVFESGGYNHLSSNGNWGIRILGSSNPNLGNPNTSMGGYNTIEDNTSYEVYNLTTNLILACNNWWGSASGPDPGDIYGSVRWIPYLTSPPDPLRSALPPPTFVNNPQIRLPAELQLAYFQQMTANFQNSANLFKSYFTNFRASSLNSLAAVQYVKSLNYYLDPSDVVNEIENTLATAQDTIVEYELLSAQAAAMVKSGQANTAIQKLDLALSLDVGLENRNRLLFQKAFIYIYRLNNTRQGETYLQQILNNSQPGSDDYRLAMEELNLLNIGNRSLPKLAGDKKTDKLPQEYCLHDNFPNPFNPTTTISYQLPENTHLIIKIYNIMGQHVKTLLAEDRQAGYYSVQWDGKNEQGKAVSSGIYFYKMSANSFSQIKRMLLLR